MYLNAVLKKETTGPIMELFAPRKANQDLIAVFNLSQERDL